MITQLHSTRSKTIVNEENYFLFTHLELDTAPLRAAFETIRPDEYCSGGYRYRALNRFWIRDRKLVPQPYEPFTQDGRYNKLWGNMQRQFPELDFGQKAMAPLNELCMRFAHSCDMDPDTVELGVHPIRTICPTGGNAPPAPEGVHTDGYPYVGLYVLRKDAGMLGAETSLLTARQGGRAVFQQTLVEGDLLCFNDVRVFHYTSPMRMSDGSSGIRDVIGLSLSPKANLPNPNGYTR